MATESRSVAAGGKTKEQETGLQKDRKKLWRVMDMFLILIMVMGSRVYTYVETQQIAHFKYVQYTERQLNLN